MHKVTGKVLHPPILATDKGKATWEEYTNRKIRHVDPVQL